MMISLILNIIVYVSLTSISIIMILIIIGFLLTFVEQVNGDNYFDNLFKYGYIIFILTFSIDMILFLMLAWITLLT